MGSHCISWRLTNPIKSTHLRGFLFSYRLTSSHDSAVKNEYTGQYHPSPSTQWVSSITVYEMNMVSLSSLNNSISRKYPYLYWLPIFHNNIISVYHRNVESAKINIMRFEIIYGITISMIPLTNHREVNSLLKTCLLLIYFLTNKWIGNVMLMGIKVSQYNTHSQNVYQTSFIMTLKLTPNRLLICNLLFHRLMIRPESHDSRPIDYLLSLNK